MTRVLFRIPALILLSFGLLGCISTMPGDLRFSGVELIEVPEVTGKEIDRGRYTLRSGYIPRLMVKLASKENIFSFAKKKGVRVSANVYFCENPNEEVLLKRGGVFIGDKSLDDLLLSNAPIDSLNTNRSGDYIYIIKIGLYSPEIDGGSITLEAFDLVKNPRDICLFLELKSMLGGYESKTVKIPKKEIKKAISPILYHEGVKS